MAWSSSTTFITFSIIFFTCVTLTNVVHCLTAQKVIDSPLLTQKIHTNRTLKVDINGKGDFTSVQAAIDAVPRNKPYIFMRGNGKGRSAIVWSQSSSDNVESATFSVEASHFIAFGISFKNEAPTGVAYTSQNQSVAAFVAADKVAFYHCGFYSTHNTLFDYKGRHYYDNCYIQGSIDFIFGRGRSVFHSCEVFVIGDKRVSIKGSVTAQNRETEKENSGFVFNKGKLYGVGDSVYLGRAKGAFSRVIYANMYLSKTVVPQGWTNWSYSGTTKKKLHPSCLSTSSTARNGCRFGFELINVHRSLAGGRAYINDECKSRSYV